MGNYLKKFLQGSETYSFTAKRWLARNEGDGAIECELVADKIVETTLKRDGSLKRKEKELRDKLISKYTHTNTYTHIKRSLYKLYSLILDIPFLLYSFTVVLQESKDICTLLNR